MFKLVVPARLESSRIPEKLLKRIDHRTILEHSAERVYKAALRLPNTDLVIAADNTRLFVVLPIHFRGKEELTDVQCRTGTDRCAQVAEQRYWLDEDIVVNVQADMPFLDPQHIVSFVDGVREHKDPWDIFTAVAPVKTVTLGLTDPVFDRKFYMSHVGIYAYRVKDLKRLAAMPQSQKEKKYSLEQYRALEAGMHLAVYKLPYAPFEINTPEDLMHARNIARSFV